MFYAHCYALGVESCLPYTDGIMNHVIPRIAVVLPPESHKNFLDNGIARVRRQPDHWLQCRLLRHRSDCLADDLAKVEMGRN